MATITNTVTLDEIINTIKLRTGITDHYRLTSVILSMLQEFNLFYIKEKKSIEINPNGRNFIELPTDFVEYQKIGYLLPSGEIQTLTKNERLVDSIDIVCGDNLSWIEQQGVDNCIDPYTVEAKEDIIPSIYISFDPQSMVSPVTLYFNAHNNIGGDIVVWTVNGDEFLDEAENFSVEYLLPSQGNIIFCTDALGNVSDSLTFDVL